MSKTRYTVETLAAGQPRAYADSIRHVRVTLENSNPLHYNADIPLEPWFVSELTIRAILPGLRCGFVAESRAERTHGLETFLTWLKPVNPRPASEVRKFNSDPNEQLAFVWEFHVTSPFTD